MGHRIHFLVLCAWLFSAGAWAEDKPVKQAPNEDATAKEAPADTIWNRDHLFGDWGGLRTSLADHGVYVDLRLTQVFQAVTSGGVDTGSAYGGVMDYIINVDAEKLGLWKGLAFNVHAQTRYGKDISALAGPLTLATTPLLYPLPGDYHGTNITGAAVYQAFNEGKFQAFAGKLHALDLVQGIFPGTTHEGVGGFMNVNALVTAMPWFRYINLSQWGGGFWSVEGGLPKAGLVILGQDNTTTSWSMRNSFNEGVGFLAFYKHSYQINGKDGFVMGFAGGSTKGYPSLNPDNWEFIPGEGIVSTVKKKPMDVAGYIYQVLWKGTGTQDIHLLMGTTLGDNDPNFSNWSTFASVEAYGVIGSRRHDRMGVSFWYTGITRNVKDLTAITLGRDTVNLWGVELYYNYQISPWLHLSADLQFLQNTDKDDDVAIVPGVRLVMDF